jgi:hypothetical protein
MKFISSPLRVPAALSSATLLLLALAACGDPRYKAPAIVVQFDPAFAPPSSLDTGAYAGIAADVSNDSKNAGVTFSCTPAGSCGSFTPAAIASAVPSCYLAPDSVPSGNEVTVTATSVTDPSKSISSSITIVSGAANPCP